MIVNQILQYLRGTAIMRLCLYNSYGQTGLVSYVDVDYAEEEDSKSTNGIIIKYRDCPVH